MKFAAAIIVVLFAVIITAGFIGIFFPLFAPLFGIPCLSVAHYGAFGMLAAFVGTIGLVTTMDLIN